MSLLDAVIAAGNIPPDTAPREIKKAYSERLSRRISIEVADGLRQLGFSNARPFPTGAGEREFQGGLGPKKVDVSYADERHGLLLAVSVKSINFPKFGKNLKNRFSDLLTEAITLHMRFPYSVVGALFAFPLRASQDLTKDRTVSTFERATKLLATISGRREYTDPGEKFENVTLMLFQPVLTDGPEPWVKLVDAESQLELSEQDYFLKLRELYNRRNPHAPIGIEDVSDDEGA